MEKYNLFKFSKEKGIAYSTIFNWLKRDNIPELMVAGVCLKLGLPLNYKSEDILKYIKTETNRVPANDNNEIGGVA